MSGHDLSRRGMLGAIATATAVIGIPVSAAMPSSDHAAFDAAVRRFEMARDADLHDLKHGKLRAAYNSYNSQTAAFQQTYGSREKAPVEVASLWDSAFRDVQIAEEDHRDQLERPHWAAAEDLRDIPAPSAEALVRKLDLLINVIDPDEVVDFVRIDLCHLAKQEAH